MVEENPEALAQRRSRFEQGQTPLHFALAAPDGLTGHAPHYELADILIELGADLEAEDDKGRTPLEIAMLHGDSEAMRRLEAAGAREPDHIDLSTSDEGLEAMGDSIRAQATPMLRVADMAATIAWYTSIGFVLQERHPEHGEPNWARLSFGKSEVMLAPGGGGPSLWFYTDRIDELYRLLKSRQFAAARAARAGESEPEVRFEEDLYEPFYGGRQFSVRDLNGVVLVFVSS